MGVNQNILFQKVATFREIFACKFFPKPIGFRTILTDTILTQPRLQRTGVNQIVASHPKTSSLVGQNRLYQHHLTLDSLKHPSRFHPC